MERAIIKEKWRLEVITPLAVLSGEEIMGVIEKKDSHIVVIPDIEKFINTYPDKVIEAINKNESIENIAVQKDFIKGRYRLELPVNKPPHIKVFIKNHLDQPYFPGSSLKGALRTGILYHLCTAKKEKFKKLFATRPTFHISDATI